MKASRKRPKGALRRPFGLVLCVVTAMPNSIGHQDLAALIARQPAVSERWRAHVRTSTFGTIHAASLSFPRIVGAAIPDPYFTQLAAVDPRALEATGSIPLNVPLEPMVAAPVYDFPVVDRRLKGDKLNVKSAPQPEPSRPPVPARTKDMASRLPAAEPTPMERAPQQVPEAVVSSPALPKGDRATPSQINTTDAAAPQVYRRAGLAAGQTTIAKRALGWGLRKPVAVASQEKPAAETAVRRGALSVGQDTLAKRILGKGPRKPLQIASPVQPDLDKPLRRAGLVAGQDTLAKRMLGLGPRKPVLVAARPAAPAPAPVASAQAGVVPAPVAVASAKPFLRGGLAAAHLNQVKAETKRLALAERVPLAETADLESQRADLRGPIVPTPAIVADAPAAQSAPEVVEAAAPAEAPGPQTKVAEVVPAPQSPAVSEDVAPAVEAPAPVAVEKNIERFNAEAVDKLASYAKPSVQNRVFFGTHDLGMGRSSWEAWEPEEVPTVLAPPHVDTEIKRAALDPQPDADSEKGGETIAPKGEVTGEGKRPRTPAERLGLSGASRAKHAKCLANAIYFEARGEVERGQMAVAQVILNRAFSGYYPGNVCDVVYQNAHRHLACQFTFACDNHKDVVRDIPRWEIATRIADEALDGKFWLPEVGKATHYHATYVNPWWVRTMTRHTKLGVHIFYRPKRWGDGEEIPVWGDRLEATGSIRREASPATPEKKNDKRAETQAATPVRRSIFDPVEPLDLPGG